jgi:zona occludens toxin
VLIKLLLLIPLLLVGRLPRNGKTYEVVLIILNALRHGRRVVSNIAGLNQQAFNELLIADGVKPENIGEIVNVTHEQVLDPLFWKTDKDKELGVTSFIQGGDLLALDEIWRFWDGFGLKTADGELKRPARVLNFFRMHGHFSHPVKGFTCEVALITQDIADFHRSVKGVIEETYMMTKLTALGSTKRYRVDFFPKTKIVKKPDISFFREYNPKYFGLYKSHSQKEDGAVDAIESNIDKRGNLLNGKLFLVVLPMLAILAFFAIHFVWGFFHPKPKVEAVNNAQNSVSSVPISQNQPVTPSSSQAETSWHIHGYYTKNGVLNVVLANNEGGYRYLINPDISLNGLDSKIMLDGRIVNNWLSKNQSNQSVLPSQ